VNRDELARIIDHSVLKPEATAQDIVAGADIVRTWRVGYYCVQPCWVPLARESLADSAAQVIAVIGFPHGCELPAIKARAASLAIDDGAREIDMVINLGALRSGDAATVADDIAAVVDAARGIPVKTIIEAAALTDDEKRRACLLAVEAGAAFVKTSTGFHASGGATVADVRLMREIVGPDIGVKASGGIRTLDDVKAMLAAGANRIGASATATILSAVS